MKHNTKITAILLTMFLVTQLIGLWVVGYYSLDGKVLPYGLEPPQVQEEQELSFFISLIISFIIAIALVFILMNIKAVWFMRAWFFSVVTLAIGVSINTIYPKSIPYAGITIIGLALILAFIKIFRRNMIIHNLTELIIYPGIAAIFVPILSLWTIILLLILISVYDIWAVWHSGIMQKMAKYQMDKVKVFGGFLIPYADKKTKEKIQLLKNKYKNSKIPESVAKKQNLKINLAILGGGDVIFPIIAAGVFMKTFNNLGATLAVTIGATLALAYLFISAKKKRFYPAMPFITTGIFLGMIIGWLMTILI